MPDEDLPVLLPDKVDYAGSGVNPLTRDEAFLNVPCPIDGEPAKRETDTMDTFIDSAWYWYRYLSPEKPDAPIDDDQVEAWTPVEQYTGGAEHAVMHLLYAREFTKMMRDIGLVQQNEPWKKVFNQGQILGMDGERMSKSRGNTQDPDELVAKYGADIDPAVPDVHGAVGPGRAVEPDRDRRRPPLPEPASGRSRSTRTASSRATRSPGRCRPARTRPRRRTAIRRAAHKTLQVVTGDYNAFHFNTMVAHLIELANTLMRYRGTSVAGAAGVGRGGPAAAADAGAGGAAHHRGALVAPAGSRERAVGLDPHPALAGGRRDGGRGRDPRGPDPGQRQAPRPGHGAGRASARSSSSRSSSPATRSARRWAASEPLKVVHAGGGRLVNIVVRPDA